jgi:hypothetical protein
MTEPTTPPNAHQHADRRRADCRTAPAHRLGSRIAEEVGEAVKDNFAKLKEAEPKLAEYEIARPTQTDRSERQAEELTRWQSEARRGAPTGGRFPHRSARRPTSPTRPTPSPQLDPSKYLDAGGQIDDDAIRTDLADVLDRKPHWRRPRRRRRPDRACPHRTRAGLIRRRQPAADPARSSHRSSRANSSGPEPPKGALDGHPAQCQQHSAAADHHGPDLREGQRAVRGAAARPRVPLSINANTADPRPDGRPRVADWVGEGGVKPAARSASASSR